MTIEEMRDLILQEELEKYNRFYFGARYVGENCISMKQLPNGQYEVCVTGERGKHTVWSMDEAEACEKVMDYLRFGKERQKKYGSLW